ncbi:MAG: aminoacyl-tRNA hydrolase [Chloroflexi bacterium]|nr:aminoacyl-tRNA hydrolase [Chloroflexota bacterium]
MERYLIVGLGNPGRQYVDTRHNIGFMAVDALANAYSLKFDGNKSKALFAEGPVAGKRVVVAKPQTYMNESGLAVRGLMDFYKIPLTHLIVVSDDLDIPLGTLRIRPKGGAGGQKGLRNIIAQVGSEDFARMRIGIGRPPGRMDAAAYVLQPFLKPDQVLLQETLSRAIKAVEVWLENGIDAAMNRQNGTAEEAAARFIKREAVPQPNSPEQPNP